MSHICFAFILVLCFVVTYSLRLTCTHGYEATICITNCKQSTLEVGEGSRNEAVRVGTLALFQERMKVKLQLLLRVKRLGDRLDCNITCYVTCTS